jgi:hypothetical protein
LYLFFSVLSVYNVHNYNVQVFCDTSDIIVLIFEPRHDKTNVMRLRPAWIQTSLPIRAGWLGSMLITYQPFDKYRNLKRTAWILIRHGSFIFIVTSSGEHGYFTISISKFSQEILLLILYWLNPLTCDKPLPQVYSQASLHICEVLLEDIYCW